MRSKLLNWWLMTITVVLVLGAQGLFVGQAQAQNIWGTLSNFDVIAVEDFNDFELLLDGITREDISNYYDGWGEPEGENTGTGVKITWKGPMVSKDTKTHFGVRTKPGSPTPTVGLTSLTLDGEIVFVFPLPWQRWVTEGQQQVIDIVRVPGINDFPDFPDFPDIVVDISRMFAVIDDPIPLNSLTQEGLAGQNWISATEEPETLAPGQDSDVLVIDIMPGVDGAVLVMYTVARQGESDPIMWVYNELPLEEVPSGVSPDSTKMPGTWGQIKELYR